MKQLYFFFLLMSIPIVVAGQDLVSVNNENFEEIKGLRLYPNPAYGNEVYITTKSNDDKEIKIYDVFGEVVLSNKLENNTLNITKLTPGIYVVQVEENRKTITRKLVVK